MTDIVLNDFDIAPPEVVQHAARDFAAALAASPQFRAFEQSAYALQEDKAAQTALQAYQAKQRSLQMMLMLNSVSVEERDELTRLYQAFAGRPSFQAYVRAEADVRTLCQEAGDLLSRHIGFDFAAACASGGCCG
jgi:cell fate (sporulation/competence/biofilm development) regulator YlbF (YheA/YmcA/DUF963 family)